MRSTRDLSVLPSPSRKRHIDVESHSDESREVNNRDPSSDGPFQEVLMTKSPVARLRTERGVTTAEYAVVTAAGCGFASVLIKLLTSEWGQRLLKSLFDLIMQVIGI
jgi:hypothetical protein